MLKTTVLITRPRGAAERLRAALGPGVATVVSPVLRIVPVAGVAPVAGDVVLTSVAGAGLAGDGRGRVAWCVGERTAGAARAAGFDAHSANGDADTLVRMILDAAPAGRLTHLRGEASTGDVAARLAAGGVACDAAVVYEQVAQAPTPEAVALLAGSRPVIAPLYSPRSAVILFAAGPFAAPVTVIAMSRAVADAVPDGGSARIIVAPNPDGKAMLRAILVELRGTASPLGA